VKGEHFIRMPHLSVLYGRFATDQKQEIIEANPLEPITFVVKSLDLYSTDGLANNWHEIFTAELSPST